MVVVTGALFGRLKQGPRVELSANGEPPFCSAIWERA